MDLGEIRCDDEDWIQLPQGRDQWWALNERCNEPSGAVKVGDFD
jgi:hypothetical protein